MTDTATPIQSIYKTPRVCLSCQQEYLPKRRPDGIVNFDFCSRRCHVKGAARRNSIEAQSAIARRPVQSPDTPPSPISGAGSSPKRRPYRSRPASPRAKHLPKADLVPFGRRLSDRRIAKGLHQQGLADLLGVHANTIVNWERGRKPMPVDKFALAAECLETTMDALWFGWDER